MGALKIRVLQVGKPRRPYVISGVDHFRRKIAPHASLDFVPVREEPHRKGRTPQQIRRSEGGRMLDAMDRGHLWTALDPNGDPVDSEGLASRMQAWLNRGRSRLGFAIGGPHGLPSTVTSGSDCCLSLSPMTFSHELTVLVVLEQIYRSLAIMNGLPYPK